MPNSPSPRPWRGADKPQGDIIRRLLQAHPGIRLVPAQKTPAAMAALMAEHDVVGMPSNSQYWHEAFGIVSIEAQHAGCRVVASDDGGLPETDCGAITLVPPDNAEALAQGLRGAIALGPPTRADRARAAARFTLGRSVDGLLAVLDRPSPITLGRPRTGGTRAAARRPCAAKTAAGGKHQTTW